jgi:hypothetical protein
LSLIEGLCALHACDRCDPAANTPEITLACQSPNEPDMTSIAPGMQMTTASAVYGLEARETPGIAAALTAVLCNGRSLKK